MMECASWVPKDNVGPGCTLEYAEYDRRWSKTYDLPGYSLERAKELLLLPEFQSEFPVEALDGIETSSTILVRESLIIEINDDGTYKNGDARNSVAAISKLSIGLKEISSDSEMLFPERFTTLDAVRTFRSALEDRNPEKKYEIVYNAPPTNVKPRIRIKSQI